MAGRSQGDCFAQAGSQRRGGGIGLMPVLGAVGEVAEYARRVGTGDGVVVWGRRAIPPTATGLCAGSGRLLRKGSQ